MENNSIYSINLNDFSHSVTTAWQELRQENDFCDVTLACEGKQLEAHKVILSGFSPVFRNLLKQNPHQHPLLYLRGVKYNELENILDFMYQGEISIAQEHLNSFLDLAKDFQIKGLNDECNGKTQQSETLKNQSNIKRYGHFNENYPPPKKKRSVHFAHNPIIHVECNQHDVIKSEPDVSPRSDENELVVSQCEEDTPIVVSDDNPIEIEESAPIINGDNDEYCEYREYEEEANQGNQIDEGVFCDITNGRIGYSNNQYTNSYPDKNSLITPIKRDTWWLDDGVLTLATVMPYPPWPAIVLEDPVSKEWYRYDDKNQMEVYVLFLEWWEQNKITDSWIKASKLEEYKGTVLTGRRRALKRHMYDLQKAISFANILMRLSSDERKKAVEEKYENIPNSDIFFNGALVLATVPYYPAWPSIISEDPDTGKWWKYVGGNKEKFEVYVVFLEWLYKGRVTYQWMKTSNLKQFQDKENDDGKKPLKKYGDDLRKAFDFAKTLQMFPDKIRLKKTSLKYGLHPEIEAQLKEKEVGESSRGEQATKTRNRRSVDKHACKERTNKHKLHIKLEMDKDRIINQNNKLLNQLQLQNKLRKKELWETNKDSRDTKRRRRNLRELSGCKDASMKYKKYRKLEIEKEKLMDEKEKFLDQLQLRKQQNKQ